MFSDADVPSDATLIGDAELSSRKKSNDDDVPGGVSVALFVVSPRPNSNGGCFFASGWSSRRLVPFVSENARQSSSLVLLDASSSRDGFGVSEVVVFASCLVFLKSVRTPPPLTPLLNRLVELRDDDVACPGEKNTTLFFALLRCSSSSSSSVRLPISKDILSLSRPLSTTEIKL